MATTSFTALRRTSGIVLPLMFISLMMISTRALGQSTSSQVTSSAARGLGVPPTYDAVWDSALTSRGDFAIVDFQDAAMYQYPAGGGAPVTVFTSGALYPGGGFSNNGFAIDPWNNLWLNNNWNGGMQWVPWNPATGTWNTAAAQPAASSGSVVGNTIGYYQTAAFGINASGLFVWSTENGTPGGLYAMNVDSSANITNFTTVISKLTSRARALAVDNAGNTYVFEDNGLPGIIRIPAGTVNLSSDQDPANAANLNPALMDVEPVIPNPMGSGTVPLLSSISGVTVDVAGNVYIGDSSAGVFMVPNQNGTLNPQAWVMVTPAPATGQISLDQSRDTLFVPTAKSWNGIKDVAAITLGNADLGSSPVGTQTATPTPIYYSFASSVTPARFVIQEDGVTTPDFSIVSGGSGSCAPQTTYPIPATSNSNAVPSCTVSIAMNPQHVGGVSAQLLMQTAQTVNKQTVYTTVSTTTLHGIGIASAVLATPASETAIGAGLKTPSQIATDAMGNIFVADAGLGAVEMYPSGSTSSSTPVPIGTGLKAPTGVAVDGNGDVFIADSPSVFEVPYGPSGLSSAGQLALKSGFGTNLRLAADNVGHLYIADPDNGQVAVLYNLGGVSAPFGQTQVSITSGFKSPTDVAVDSENNLYVIDGSNLIEESNGAQTTLLTSLSGATGVAVDSSGAVYISSAGGTVRIPLVSGTLNTAQQASVAPSVILPSAVTVDNLGNTYLTDATGGNVHVVNASGALNFGTLAATSTVSTLPATFINNGNAPLTVTGYSSTNSIDYTGADGTCMANSPIAPAGTCDIEVTMNPGPGEQGTLTGQIGIQSNAANSSVVVNATGVGAPLAASVSSITVAGNAEVVNAPVTVTVAPKSGSGVPTGQVTVTFTTVAGANSSVTGTLVNGSVSLTLSSIAAGNSKIAVAYGGDRVFGRSTASVTSPIAKSQISGIALPATAPPYLPYVLESNGTTPYDGSTQYWEYNFIVTVAATKGQPTGTVTFNDSSPGTNYSGVACPALGSAGVQPIASTGQAIFPTTCLPMIQTSTYTPIISTHTITPVYSGDANYQGFTGQTTTFQVVRSPSVVIAALPSSLSVSAGSSASASLMLTSILGYGFAGKNQQLNDYNFPVSLACSNLPPHATCSFTYPTTVSPAQPSAPNSVQIPCSGTTAAADNCTPGQVTVTVNTSVSVGTTTSSSAAPAGLAGMFGAGLIGLLFRRRLGRNTRLLMMLCLAILGCALSVSLTACQTNNLSPASVLTTPKGTYAVTVTAQQVGSQVINLAGGSSVTIYGSQNQVSLPFTLNVTVQ